MVTLFLNIDLTSYNRLLVTCFVLVFPSPRPGALRSISVILTLSSVWPMLIIPSWFPGMEMSSNLRMVRDILKSRHHSFPLLVLKITYPPSGIMSVGSGGIYALSAARALIDIEGMDAETIARKSMKIAADICVYTNHNTLIEILDVPDKKMKEDA